MKSIVEKARKIVTQLYERNMVSWNDLDREVVFAIQALNAEVQRMEALAQPEQEPVAMRYDFDGYGYKYIDNGSGSDWKTRIKEAEPVYALPQRKPLTDDELSDIWFKQSTDWMEFARVIEAAHGIKENT